jgi:polyferredoxin
MLRKIRTAVAIAVIAILTFGFLDFSGILNDPWLQKIQFGPALLSLSVVTLVCLIAATLIFGRLYCSVVCPLGIFQDFFNWLSKKIDKRKKYFYKPENPWLRWGVLAVLVVAWLCGFTFLVGLVEPYSAYGRMADELFKPIYLFGNNLLAAISEKAGSYRFFKVLISLKSISALVVALLTLLVVGHISYHHGRTWCNTICPVGTVLGFFSRFSILRMRIDQDKCNHCLACQRKCKAYCIDSVDQKIDYSRCVDCFDCIEACRQKAISYGPVKMRKSQPAKQTESVDESKRQFLKSTLVIAALAPAALEAKVTGKKDTRVPMSPPGSGSHRNLLQHCTACHLCVSKCPSHVLKPAGMEYGLGGIMQPVMKFDEGYCNYDCNLCSQICPAGAIKPLTVEQKHVTQPGHVVFNKDICVVNVNRTSCGACAEHCPVQALHMIPFEGGLTIPEANTELCVGCGGCEFICPVKAVHIEGNPTHLEAKVPEQDTVIETQDFDFGF